MKNKNTKYYIMALIVFVILMIWFGGSSNRELFNAQLNGSSNVSDTEETIAAPEVEIVGDGELEIEVLE